MPEVKSEGSGVRFDTANEGYTSRYTHETVALAFALTEEAVEDNLYDRLGSRYTKALARSMANTKQIKAAAVLNNAFDTTGGDGVSLINTAHPLGGGGTLANRATTMADLNETSLEDALINISTFTDDKGLNIALKGMKLIVPPQLQFVADRLLQTPGRVGTSDNDINSIRNQGMIPDGYVVNHYLTDTDAFFLKTDCPDGFKYFERSPMQTALEGDFDTGNMRYKARERYSFGYSNFRAVYGSQGA
jgi:phage major head subunit gpT-like protein